MVRRMRTISNPEFLTGLEDGTLEWPPVVIGNFTYTRVSNPDRSEVGNEFVRTATPP